MNGDHIEEVNKNIDQIEHVEKFNPYHDSRGRFASANGAASFTYSPGKSKAHDAAIAREKERQAAGGAAAGGEKSLNEGKTKAELTKDLEAMKEGSQVRLQYSYISQKTPFSDHEVFDFDETYTKEYWSQPGYYPGYVWKPQSGKGSSMGSEVLAGDAKSKLHYSDRKAAQAVLDSVGTKGVSGDYLMAAKGDGGKLTQKGKSTEAQAKKPAQSKKTTQAKQPEVFDMVGYMSQGMTINSKGQVVPANTKKSIDTIDHV